MGKWKIGWGLSNACNMRCGFCYSRSVRKEPNFERRVEEGLNFVLRNKDKIESINFGTGEPTIEPMLFKLIEAIRKDAPHILIGITTNGTLAEAVKDPYNMDVLRKWIDDIDVSLDYGTAAEQDRSRGYDGAFALAIRSLELCQKLGKNTTVVNALHKYNGTIENVDRLVQIARIYNADFRINIYRPTAGFDFVIGYPELRKILTHLVKYYEIDSLADPLFASLFGTPCEAGDPCAKSSFRIIPNGFITPSTYLLDNEWRAQRVDEVEDIDDLRKMESFTRVLNAPIPQECGNCHYREKCRGGVIDRRWLFYHDLSKRDPYCPHLNGDDTDWTSLSGSAILSQERKSFVHDGYLPTLIFSPVLNERVYNRWDKIYRDSEEEYASSEPEKTVTELSGYLSKEAHILDLGSGLGRNGLYYLRRGGSVTFADHSKIACDRLLKTILKEQPDGPYEILDADIRDVLSDMDAESQDAVLAIHVISHGTPDEIEQHFVKEIYRVLKPGGVSALTLPSVHDRRCQNMPESSEGIRSAAFTEGSEAGIVHSFYNETAVEKLFRTFEIIRKEEIHTDANSHWHLIVRKR